MPKRTAELQRWCHDLGAALTAKTRDRIVVSPRGAKLDFECEWDAEGHPTIAGSLPLPLMAASFCRTISPERYCAEIWAQVGSWVDFYLFWSDHQREQSAA